MKKIKILFGVAIGVIVIGAIAFFYGYLEGGTQKTNEESSGGTVIVIQDYPCYHLDNAVSQVEKNEICNQSREAMYVSGPGINLYLLNPGDSVVLTQMVDSDFVVFSN
ncbi:MAG: hypothetical protein H6581_02965 [Bacteroidia bacterium]|nr:hypothetical protein [Bacteroidia bacterium]